MNAVPLGHRALGLLDMTAAAALAAVRGMLANSAHTPVPAKGGRTGRPSGEAGKT